MRRSIPLLSLFLLSASLGTPGASPALASPAADRGRLSLAWDAHEAGLFEEALGYLADVPIGSEVGAEAAWLRAECFYDLGRYDDAVRALDGVVLIRDDERREFLADVFWGWAWDETARGRWAEVVRILDRGLELVPGDGTLEALREASRFRGELARALEAGEDRLPSGERVSVRPAGSPPRGADWVRAHPWAGISPWLPEATLEDWMPGLADRLARTGEVLWVLLPQAALTHGVGTAAARKGLGFAEDATGYRVTRGSETVRLLTAEWRFRAGVEGLGIAGAALFAVARAEEDLSAREEVSRWVDENRGELLVGRQEGLLVLRNEETGRTFELRPEEWSDLLGAEPEEWSEFWSDLRAELARPPEPFRCFCGRPVTLRGTLVADVPGLLVLERGRGYATAAVALCPLHHQRVTERLARQWGVGAAEVRDRLRSDALEKPWEIRFARGEAEGSPYLLLDGDGVSSLARSPEFLAGALESVDGAGACARSVRVRALTDSALLVTDAAAPESVGDAAASRSLLALGRRGHRYERVDYRATLSLPARGAGRFRVSLAE